MEQLKISENKKYLMCGNEPFFWLGDTAWLIFNKLTEDEAYTYLRNRRDKGYTVIQAVLVYSIPTSGHLNKMYIPQYDVSSKEYWEHCDRVIKMADELGLYMALLPSWGSLVKKSCITTENAQEYAEYLGKRYKEYSNIIWVLGGDIKPMGYEEIYDIMGKTLKRIDPTKLITFHPFGRCTSSTWFNDCEWLDFNMFQSGHRRYDQLAMGAWDDNPESPIYYGEDNWRYVLHNHAKTPLKPTLDAEPSYEWIVQGLHDMSEPYWRAKDVRRFAYWSVFAGSCGHTYGDNAVMQFYDKEKEEEGSYGVIDSWQDAIHHEGSGQMRYLKELMESVDYVNGAPRDELIVGGQREKHERIAVFAGAEYVLAYVMKQTEFSLDLSEYGEMDAWWLSPVTGVYSYAGKASGEYEVKMPPVYDIDEDRVLVLKKS